MKPSNSQSTQLDLSSTFACSTSLSSKSIWHDWICICSKFHWTSQMKIQVGGVSIEVVAALVTWDRVAHIIAPELAADVENLLGELSVTAEDGDLEQAYGIATELRDLLADL